MLETEIDEKNNIFVVTPKGTVSEADFEGLGATVNDYINRTDQAPSIVLDAAGLPHWKNSAALFAHMKLVRDHHKLISKVALVSDSTTLSIMPALVDHFLDAKIRHFPQSKLEEAKSWASLVDPQGSSLKMMDGMPSDVIAYEVAGTLTSKDYDEVLTPLVNEKLKTHDKVKILVVLGDAFDGATPMAMWDDARLGFGHLTGFSKLALVSDIGWIRQAAKLFAPLFPAQTHVFALDELDDAKAWIIS
jgi:hypothetical protein